VELRCAGGAVLQAHSLVLQARCEWFRRRQSSGLHQGAAAELPEHTATTIECVLQYLYTGHACLSTASPEASSEGAAASAPSAAAADEGATGKPTGLWQLLHSVPYFQGLSDHDPVALLPLVMVAADQLQLPDLHEACLQLAQCQLSPKTALPWLLAAHMGRQEALEKIALQYVVENTAGMSAAGRMLVYIGLSLVDETRASSCRCPMVDCLSILLLLIDACPMPGTHARRCCGALPSFSRCCGRPRSQHCQVPDQGNGACYAAGWGQCQQACSACMRPTTWFCAVRLEH
jgi:hypothetical protein